MTCLMQWVVPGEEAFLGCEGRRELLGGVLLDDH